MRLFWSYVQLLPRAQQWLVRLALIGLSLIGLLISLHLSFPLPPPKTFSTTVLAADSSLLCAYLTPDDKWRMRSSPDAINADMLRAIIAKEDRWFYYHPGINPGSIIRALAHNLLRGRRTSGASTISMQLARMREPAPRTYGNKLREMLRALQYEWTYSKREILEMYLSYLPYGGNVEGVMAASYLYFDRPPAKLSLSQAILLAVIPNRPNSLRLDHHSEDAQLARDAWIHRFQQRGLFDAAHLNAARHEPVPGLRHRLPPRTPQFCYALQQQHPQQRQIRSTLRPALQQTAQRLLQNHVRRLKAQGVSNGAVLVVDNQTHEVVAYCGSADFYDTQAQGQVDGVQGLRSPGSALKPFAYALGFERGVITPRMKLLDVPTTYQGFRPENYDLTYLGQPTVHQALSHSLNVPPVRLVQEMGLDGFLDVLEALGFERMQAQRDGLGLSAVLGGCGVTLYELVRAYHALSQGGRLHALQTSRPLQPTEGRQVLSEEAVWLVLDILDDIERPDIPQAYLEASQLPKVAWKTGTSYGHRDAWAIGLNPRYTIGVWMGNFDGQGVPELSGSRMAVPLMLDLFTALDQGKQRQWFAPPQGIGQRQVCAETGLIPGPHCKNKVHDHYIVDVSPLQACALYQSLYVNADTSLQYCPVCLPPEGYQRVAFPMYEPELALWFARNEVGVLRPPPHDPRCTAKLAGDGPQILSPSQDFEYLLERGQRQELLLQAASEPGVSTHHWYANGRYLGEVPAGQDFFYHPTTQRLRLTCMDEKGRKSETEVKVVFY